MSGSKCGRCPKRKTCWAAPHCRGTCDTCECPFDATLTCEACTNATCTKRGSRPAKDAAGRTIWRIPR